MSFQTPWIGNAHPTEEEWAALNQTMRVVTYANTIFHGCFCRFRCKCLFLVCGENCMKDEKNYKPLYLLLFEDNVLGQLAITDDGDPQEYGRQQHWIASFR
jgi:hypothetical protein